MKDKQSIKKVLESQGDMHEKVANQSNSKLSSLSPTQSTRPPHIQIDVHIAYDLYFGCSTNAWKNKEITFPMTSVSCPTKIGVVRNHQKVPISRTVFGVALLFWPDGLCIQLESIRDMS
jgi:hypothetical protein